MRIITIISVFILMLVIYSSSTLYANNNAVQAIRDRAVQLCIDGKLDETATLIKENTVLSVNGGAKYIVFSPQEKIFSDYVTNNFVAILNDARNGLSEEGGYLNKNTNEFKEYYLIATDTLDLALASYILSKGSEIQSNIDKSSLSQDEKTFLKLKFNYTKAWGNFCSIDKQALKSELDSFSVIGKDTALVSHCQDLTWSPTRTKFGAASGIYTGAVLFSGEVAEQYSNGLPIGLAFDFSYGRFRLISQFGLSTGISTKKVLVDDTWTNASKVNFSHINLGLSYNVSVWQQLNILPYVGMHTSSLRNTAEGKFLHFDEPDNVSSGLKPSFGLTVDYNITLNSCDNFSLTDTERNIIFIRLQSLYVPDVYSSSSYPIKGDLLFTTIGIGIYTDELRK